MKISPIAWRYIFGVFLFVGLSTSLTGCQLGKAIVKKMVKSVSLTDPETNFRNQRESKAAWLNATGGGFDGTWPETR